MLRDQADYEAALREVEALAGCLERTEEESQMIEVVLSIEVYEARCGVEP